MISIERRIGSGLLLSLLATLIILALLADYGVARLSREFVYQRIEHDADSLIKALAVAADGSLTLDPAQVPVIYQRVNAGHYFQVLGTDQRLRSRSLWDQTPAVVPQPTGRRRFSEQQNAGQHWLVLELGIALQEQPLTLWIAEDIAPLERQWRDFTAYLYAAMLLALVALLLLQRGLLRRSFRQINRVKTAIQQLQQGEIAALTDQVPSEIAPLTAEINHLLARLEQRTSRSRTAIGNLAHELKRSLQQLRLLRSAVAADQQAAYDQVLSTVTRLIERELQRARIAGTPHPGRRFNPTADVDGLIEVLKRIYPGVRFTSTIEVATELPFDRDDMLELLGNLLDNAAKFGASRVAIEIRRQGPAAAPRCRLQLTDNGPGIAGLEARQLTERGVRVDESVEGHGLGLSICTLIATSYNGNLSLQAANGGGLQVVVELPL